MSQDEDFIPPGNTSLAAFGLEDGKEQMVIQLKAASEKAAKDKDAKEKDKDEDCQDIGE